MPELPEVETTRRGIAPVLEGKRVARIVVRQRQLRWPVPRRIERELRGQTIERVERRAKYLLLRSGAGTALLHLGMSGSLRVVAADLEPGKHDHVDIALEDGLAVRLRDPRRFGSLLWTRRSPELHPLLRGLGPEPLQLEFSGEVLHASLRGKRCSIKIAIMDSRIVVGVGNIYASEALFLAGIRPSRAAGSLSALRCERLALSIKKVLQTAIEAGGTTLRDFASSDGRPGYFQQQLSVYGRGGEPCPSCGRALHQTLLGQRATYHCSRCQR